MFLAVLMHIWQINVRLAAKEKDTVDQEPAQGGEILTPLDEVAAGPTLPPVAHENLQSPQHDEHEMLEPGGQKGEEHSADDEEVGLTIYLDDRTLWAETKNKHKLMRALKRGDEIDKVLGWTLNRDKCQVAAGTDEIAEEMVTSVGYNNNGRRIETLGLSFDVMDEEGTTYKKKAVEKAERLIRAIAIVSDSGRLRKIHTKTFVTPSLIWAGVLRSETRSTSRP